MTDYTKKVDLAEDLYRDTGSMSGSGIQNSDTILKDIMDEVSFEVNGIPEDMFDIYRTTKDKNAFCELFELFTDTRFETYLNRCIEDTTRRVA